MPENRRESDGKSPLQKRKIHKKTICPVVFFYEGEIKFGFWSEGLNLVPPFDLKLSKLVALGSDLSDSVLLELTVGSLWWVDWMGGTGVLDLVGFEMLRKSFSFWFWVLVLVVVVFVGGFWGQWQWWWFFSDSVVFVCVCVGKMSASLAAFERPRHGASNTVCFILAVFSDGINQLKYFF